MLEAGGGEGSGAGGCAVVLHAKAGEEEKMVWKEKLRRQRWRARGLGDGLNSCFACVRERYVSPRAPSPSSLSPFPGSLVRLLLTVLT